MRVLIVEDDKYLIDQLTQRLQQEGYVTERCGDGVSASFWVGEGGFDAIILDLGLPKKSGLEVLSDMREQQNLTPVLILTARDSWQERVDGLKAGADDYLGKPFHMEELLARLEALIRRKFGQARQMMEYQGVRLDPDTQMAWSRDGEEFQLTGIEYRLLRYLLMNPEKVLSKTVLSEHVYEEEHVKDSNVIEVYINRLRHRFGKRFIQTRRGQGYCLRSPEELNG